MEDEFRRAFALYDKNGDGLIDVHELESLVEGLGMKSKWEDLSHFVAECDLNSDEHLDYDEFRSFLKNVPSIADTLKMDQVDQSLRVAFLAVDKNGDGFVDRSELRSLLTEFGDPLSESELTTFFSLVDTDGDGRLCFDEFVQVFRTEHETPLEDDSELPDFPTPEPVESEGEEDDDDKKTVTEEPKFDLEAFELDSDDGDVLPPLSEDLSDTEDDDDSSEAKKAKAKAKAKTYPALFAMSYVLDRVEKCVPGTPSTFLSFSISDSLLRLHRRNMLCNQVTRDEKLVRAVPTRVQEKAIRQMRRSSEEEEGGSGGLIRLVEKRTRRNSGRCARVRRRMTRRGDDLKHALMIRLRRRGGDDDDSDSDDSDDSDSDDGEEGSGRGRSSRTPPIVMDPVSSDVGDLAMELVELILKWVDEYDDNDDTGIVQQQQQQQEVMQMPAGGEFRPSVAEPSLESFLAEETERKKALLIPSHINLEYKKFSSRQRVKGSPTERIEWTIRDSLFTLVVKKTLCGKLQGGGTRFMKAICDEDQERIAAFVRDQANLVSWGGEVHDDNMFWLKTSDVNFESGLNDELEAQVMKIMKYSKGLVMGSE